MEQDEIDRYAAIINMSATRENARPSGVELIAAERLRQMTTEGWTPAHDDEHSDGSLAMAAATYAAVAFEQAMGDNGPFVADPELWPWKQEEFKPKDQLRNLVRAGALIAAEIDRLQRAQPVEAQAPRNETSGRGALDDAARGA